MRKTLPLLQIGALSSLLLAACGPAEDFDITSLSVASEDDKSDAASKSPLTWTRPSASSVVCVRHPCATRMTFDVNTGASHLVYAYDFRALKLSSSDEQNARAQAANMLLYGRYTSVRVAGEPMEVYQVTRANMRVSDRTDSPESDRYYSTKTATTSCPQQPCSGLAAQRLNMPTGQPELWSSVDLTGLGLSTRGVQQLSDEIASGKAYVSTSGPAKPTSVPIGQAFRPLQAGPLP